MSIPAINSVAWFEIGTDRPSQVKEFYGQMFGWTSSLNTNLPGVNYHAVVTPAAAPATNPTTAPAPAETSTADAAAPTLTTPGETATTTKGIQVTVGPVTADKGELGIGKLGVPKDRYAKCVEDNGGLKGTSGEVHVRFLVRSKGVAEGVSVQKRQNVSAEAAHCIAEVVDRRRVGVPDEPLVGATLVIKLAAP